MQRQNRGQKGSQLAQQTSAIYHRTFPLNFLISATQPRWHHQQWTRVIWWAACEGPDNAARLSHSTALVEKWNLWQVASVWTSVGRYIFVAIQRSTLLLPFCFFFFFFLYELELKLIFLRYLRLLAPAFDMYVCMHLCMWQVL